jgi:hypothetical protein
MIRRLMLWSPLLLLLLSGCNTGRESDALLSMQVITINATQLPDSDKWKDLVGRPIIAVEYKTVPELGIGGRTLYLYDARSGECKTVVSAPVEPGGPMLIAWAPCK